MDEYGRPPMVSKLCLMLIVWIGVALATAAVALRAYIRLRYNGRFQLDDFFTAFAYVLLVASAIMYVAAVDPLINMELVMVGQLEPGPDFTERTELYMRLQFAITLAFWTCLWTVKASFLTFFYPLSDGLKFDRILWYCVTAFVGLGYIACVISYPIACHEFYAGACNTDGNIDRSLVSLRMSTTLDVTSDMLIILIPWKLLWIVQRSRREKIAIGSIVGLGIVVIFFSIVRIVLTNTKHSQPDPLWLGVWSSIETSVAVIVISLTSLKVFFIKCSGSATGYGSRNFGYLARSVRKNGSTRGAIPMGDTGYSQEYRSYSGKAIKGSSSNESEEILVR